MMMTEAASRVLGLLQGEWTIERRVQPGGQFTGTATFTPLCADTLLYRESGRTALDGGAVLFAANSYVYALRNGLIAISFASGPNKGAQFIDLKFEGAAPDELPVVSAGRHLCGADVYDATFRIESAGRFVVTYHVSGPTKAYVSRSVYRRIER